MPVADQAWRESRDQHKTLSQQHDEIGRMAPSNSPDGRDMVKLRAVFVPDGQTAPAELIAGMVDIVRLSVDLLPDDGGPTDGSDGGIPRPTPERRGQTT